MSTYNDASLIYYPSGYKAGKAYSLKPTDGSGDLTFTRASTATRVNAAGLIESVATGVPRIDYTGGGCGKLLLEGQRTNLILNSNEITSADWIINASGIRLDNQIISPDGTNNGGTFESTGSSALLQNAGASVTIGQPYTNSIYLKRISGTSPVNIRDVSGNTIPITLTSEWQRFSSSLVATSSAGRIAVTIDNAGTTIGVYAGQVENGSYATSYIPTTTTAVTRVADSASKSGISSLINSEEGVLYAEIAALADDLSNRQISLNNGTTDDRIQLYYTTPSNTVSVFYKSQSGATAFILNHTLADITQFNKLAFKWKENDFALWSNGVEVATQTSGVTSIPNTLTRLDFEQFNGSADFYGNCQSLMVFPSALSDTELATLTTL